MANRKLPVQDKLALSTYTVLVEGEDLGGLYGLKSMIVSKTINRIPTARIILEDGNVAKEDFEISSGDMFIPGKEVEINAGYSMKEDPIFKGIVIRHSIKTSRASSALIVDLKDAVVAMTAGRKNKYFEEVTDSDVMEELLGTYSKLIPDVETTKVKHLEMVQYYVSDWDFMVTRAEANGQVVFVDDGKVTVKKPDLSASPIAELAYGHNVLEFEAGVDARDQYATTKSMAWDYAKQEVLEEEGKDPGFEEQGNLKAKELADVLGLESFDQVHSGKVSDQELKAWSDAKLSRSRLSHVQGRVKTHGGHKAKPGETLNFVGFGDRFNGKAFISSVTHTITPEEGWYSDIQFGLPQDWFVEKYENVSARPASGLIPPIQGLQNGVVTNVHEDPDGEFRVKVRIPVIDPQNEGVWARVAAVDAGANRGLFFRPEIEDEVIVGFFNDDPTDPVVLGMLHSSAKASPVNPAEENNEKGLYTKSEMKLVFDDDLISVTLETPKGNKMVLSEDEGGITMEDENGNKLVMSADGIMIESAADLIMKASGDVTIEGTNLTSTAQSQYLAEGSAGAELSSGGQAVIKGALVAIN
ncbi:MAG: type VI secretion system tip protein VgrG [Cytophagales bacterium]|nr:type VI secretion system tip protein VgrG [Cytophagales bacterium]